MPTVTDAKGKRPIQQAKDKTREVREDLELAEAELQLTTTIMERAVQPPDKGGDLRKAIDRNGAIAANVAEATEELAEVEALLEHEVEERRRLEREIARRR